MGLFDKAKKTLSGNKEHVDKGIDMAADQAEKVVPDEHDDKVDQAAEAAKDALDKLDD